MYKLLILLIFFNTAAFAETNTTKITIEVKDIENKIKKMKISPVRTKGKTILYNLHAIDNRVLPKAVLLRVVECKDGIKKLEVPSKKWRECNVVIMTEPTNIYLNSYRYIKPKNQKR